VSEFRVELIWLISEVGGSMFLVLATRLQEILNPRDTDTGLICNENLGSF
jgi:hypothetical protein